MSESSLDNALATCYGVVMNTWMRITRKLGNRNETYEYVHAQPEDISGYVTLCGQTDFIPDLGEDVEYDYVEDDVDCPQCLRVIAHCHRYYTRDGKRKKRRK